MREFLFKGKQISNDEWVEGSLLIDEKGNHYIGTYIPKYTPDTYMIPARGMGKTMTRFVGMGFVMVDPETVGQYTGLTAYWEECENEMHEADVWEHDFLEVTYEGEKIIAEVEFEAGMFILCSNEFCDGYIPLFDVTSVDDIYYINAKKIGNIHDNPELLKDGE